MSPRLVHAAHANVLTSSPVPPSWVAAADLDAVGAVRGGRFRPAPQDPEHTMNSDDTALHSHGGVRVGGHSAHDGCAAVDGATTKACRVACAGVLRRGKYAPVDGIKRTSGGDRPGLELVSARRLHGHPRVVAAHRRDLRAGAHRRGHGGHRAASARSRSSARWRRSTCSRTSARPAAWVPKRRGRGGDQRDPRRRERRGLPGAGARAHGLPIRVLSGEEEARYGYLAAINSTTLSDGCVLDLGGGSLQLVRVCRARGASSRTPGAWGRCG